MGSALQGFFLRHPVAGHRATRLTNVKPPAAARAYFYAGPEHAGTAGIHKDPAMSYTPDNAQLLNAMQNVMVISTTDLQGNITSYISIRRVVNDLMQNYDLVEFSKEKFDDFYEAA